MKTNGAGLSYSSRFVPSWLATPEALVGAMRCLHCPRLHCARELEGVAIVACRRLGLGALPLLASAARHHFADDAPFLIEGSSDPLTASSTSSSAKTSTGLESTCT
jgi:hypothetical protein